MSFLATPPGEVGSMIKPGMLPLSLGDRSAKTPPSSPCEDLLQLPAPDSEAPAILKVPSQEDMHGSPHEPSDDAPVSTSEVAGDVHGSPPEISFNSPPADP